MVAIAHTVVSKAEGAIVELAGIRPSDRAVEPGRRGRTGTLASSRSCWTESREILRAERGVLISRTRHGFVCANAGVDASNAPAPDTVVLLPARPRRLGPPHPGAAARAAGQRPDRSRPPS